MAEKPLAMLALEKMSPKGDAAEEASEASGLEMAMQDLLAAIESKDAVAMAEAFRSASAMADDTASEVP